MHNLSYLISRVQLSRIIVETVSKSLRNESIYLDYHATTPCDPRVVQAVSEALQFHWGNPSSPHSVGQRADRRVEVAREAISTLINALPGELIFTGGATESNNLAVLGICLGARDAGNERYRLLTSEIEHKSVLKAASAAREHHHLLEHGCLPVTTAGIVDLERAREMIDDRTLLVSVQAVNNELGTIQPIKEIASIAHSKGALVHCDAAQALGRIEIDVEEWKVDFLSLSAHKAYGPKGIGALYLSGGKTSQPIKPLFAGGGQEEGLRPGTLNVAGIEGFGEACRIIQDSFHEEVKRFKWLRDRFENEVVSRLDDVNILNAEAPRVTSTSSLHIKGVEAEALIARLTDVVVSTGSACESGALEPSHVLEAIGLSRGTAYECIRVAVGRFTQDSEPDVAANAIVKAAKAVREVLV